MKNLIFILIFLSQISLAQESVTVDLSNPNSTIYTHLYFLQETNYQPRKAAKTIFGLPEKEAIDKAIKLKKIFDGKGLYIDFSKIPSNPLYNDTIGYTKVYRYIIFPTRMPEISVEKIDGKWYYSKETVSKIDGIYNDVFPWYVHQLQKLIPESGYKKILGIELWQFVGILLLLVFTIMMIIVIKKIIYWLLQRLQQKITHKISDNNLKLVLKKLAHPLSLVFGLQIIDVVFPSLQFSLAVNTWIFLALHIAETVFWIFVFLKLVKVIIQIYEQFTLKTESKLDDQLVPIIRNLLTGIVIIIGFFRMLQLFGVETTTLLAGATIGGLAFALASQDTVKNLIGTVMIFIDKPFHIGDWIVTSELEGMVEQVGFRSTKVRAADTSIFQIPNSKLSEIVINNKGLLLFRRYKTELGIHYDTPPELIEAFTQGIRKLILAHPKTNSQMFNVAFVGFGNSALLILMNVYFISLDWNEEQSSKHKLHLAILDLARELGVHFAVPFNSHGIENFSERTAMPTNIAKNSKELHKAIDKVLAKFELENPKESK